MAQHKWHKEIKAWADGAEIEMWYRQYSEYRSKPQPVEPQYLGVAVLTDGRIILVREWQLIPLSKGQSVHKIIGKIPLIVEEKNS